MLKSCDILHIVGLGFDGLVGFLCPNDVREFEDMNLIPAEKGGFTYMVNGSMTPLESAGAAYRKDGEERINSEYRIKNYELVQ